MKLIGNEADKRDCEVISPINTIYRKNVRQGKSIAVVYTLRTY